MADFAIGSVFAGHRIEGIAGRGGMGVVYRATQLRPERTVALKVIAPEFSDDAGFRARFERESQVAASIDNPNVLPLFQAGEEEGRLYISMRFVRGTDLGQLLEREGRLDPARAARIIDQIGYALDVAHQAGLVHRDVKPGNILIEGSGHREHAYLTDFGLSKKAASRSGMTATGMFVGTIDYMAPEQFEGREIDARTDIYALGCVLFECLTGQIPYQRDTEPAKMFAHMTEPPPSVLALTPGLPHDFEGVIARALAKKPSDRYTSTGDLARAALSAAEGRALPSEDRVVATGEAAPAGATGAQPGAPVPGTQAAAIPGTQAAPVAGTQATPAPGTQESPAPQPPVAPAAPGYAQPEGARPPTAAPPAQARPRSSRTPLLIGGIVLGVALLAGLVIGALSLFGGPPALSKGQYEARMKTILRGYFPDHQRFNEGNEAGAEIRDPAEQFAHYAEVDGRYSRAMASMVRDFQGVEPPPELAGEHQRLIAIYSRLVSDLEQTSAAFRQQDPGAAERSTQATERANGELGPVDQAMAAKGVELPLVEGAG